MDTHPDSPEGMHSDMDGMDLEFAPDVDTEGCGWGGNFAGLPDAEDVPTPSRVGHSLHQELQEHAAPPEMSHLRRFLASTLRCDIQALERGGGGDCLFLSIAAGLQTVTAAQPDTTPALEAKLAMPIAAASRIALAQRLRWLVAEQLEAMQPEEFLDLLILFRCEEVLAQQHVPGAVWQDGWSPTQLLTQHGLHELLTAENVQAVGPNDDMGPEHILILYRRGNHSVQLPVPNGVSSLRALRVAVGNFFRQPGHVHWGTATDLRMLAVALDIGFIVFSSAPQDGAVGRRWIYGLNCDRGDFPLWMVLYNRGNVHFQLAALMCHVRRLRHSVFRTAELPETVVQHYNLCNGRNPIGSHYRGGVN